MEFAEEGHDVVARARVQITGGFVGEQHRRIVDQRAGDRHPLLLAARELARQVMAAVAQAYALERGASARTRSRPDNPA